MFVAPVRTHSRIVGALMMREIMTRYGREGLGFLWLVAEPLVFCLGVLVMWSFLKPPYEHGIRLGPFVMTGYMCLLMLRHLMASLMSALQANSGLLYHSRVSILHIYISRILLEVSGASVAFMIVYAILIMLGQVSLPHDYGLFVGGWLLMAWLGSGLALIFSGLAIRSELFERLTSFLTYALIPISGAFAMASFFPEAYRDTYLLIPFPHATEMIRGAVFGEFVPTYYDAAYAFFCGAVLNFLGLVLIATARDHLEVE